MVVEDFRTVAIAEHQVGGTITVEIGKADSHHHLVSTIP